MKPTLGTNSSPKFDPATTLPIITPAGWKCSRALGEFSCSYIRWGTLKSEGRQIQYGQTTPAIAIVDNRLKVVTERPERYYRQAQFWLSAGPVLVRHYQPVAFSRWRRQFPTLDISRSTHRVAICVRDNTYWFVYCYGTLKQLQQRCLRSGAESALHLDGGSCVVFRCAHRRLRGSRAQLQVVVLPRRTNAPGRTDPD